LGLLRTTDGIISSVALNSEASMFAASRGKTSSLSMLVDGVADPVDSGIVSNRYVVRIDHDYLVVLEGGILVDPVRVEHSEVHAGTAGSLLCNRSQVANKLKLVDTVVLGLAVYYTLVVGPLPASSAHSNAVDNVALLGLVSELVCLISSSGLVDLLAPLSLSVLPGANSE